MICGGFFITYFLHMCNNARMNQFDLQHEYTPSGDQPEAIKSLVAGLKKGMGKQTLLGATGTGKTFTIANVIEQTQKTTLVIAHNKTLAAQLAQEFREFFPNNAVHYFVSYYDYYQPEAYIAVSDTFIEKDASINEKIDRLRHASTQSLLSRPDTIIVASVSCIYGLGSPEDYLAHNLFLKKGDTYARNDLMKMFVSMHYSRTTADVANSSFRVLGNVIEIMPVADTFTYRLELEGNILVRIDKMDPVSSTFMEEDIESVFIFPAKHFMTNDEKKTKAIKAIRKELKIHLSFLEKKGLLLEAERLKRRTNYDLAMMEEIGYCSGIENYSRHLSGKKEGEAPETLISYFPHKKDGSPDFLTVVDESHVTLPQLRAMHAGDASRKNNLIEYGFRLPSARDNRPLKYEEFEKKVGQTIYVSATPGGVEKEISDQIVEQVIRPTGLVDPEIDVRPIIPKGKYEGQVKDFIQEAQKEIEKGNSILCTTLTKKMAEDLSEFLKDEGIKAEYLHSDIKTIDRIRIL
ncbi:MAG: excinuclease ABC subunit B, partial [Flavobacteriaceae bacterium]